jgi:putative membrane protein
MIGQFDFKRFVLRLAINIIAILIAVTIVPGLHLEGPWWGLAVVALIFGLINTGIRPLLFVLTLPFVIVTLGLFMLFINALMLYLTSWLAEGFGISLLIDNFFSAILGAIIISVISTALSLLSGDQRVQVQVIRDRRDE